MHGDHHIIETVQSLVEAGDGAGIMNALPPRTFAATPKLVWNPGEADLDGEVLKRVYRHWYGCCPAGSIPTAEDAGLTALASSAPNISVVHPVRDGWDFAYEYYGTAISHRTGFVATDRHVSTMPFSPGIKVHFTAGYRAVLARRAPLLAWHVTPLDRSSSSWDRLILPLRSSEGSQDIAQILVCMEARAWNFERPHCS